MAEFGEQPPRVRGRDLFAGIRDRKAGEEGAQPVVQRAQKRVLLDGEGRVEGEV